VPSLQFKGKAAVDLPPYCAAPSDNDSASARNWLMERPPTTGQSSTESLQVERAEHQRLWRIINGLRM
jgi:hypothetical protein